MWPHPATEDQETILLYVQNERLIEIFEKQEETITDSFSKTLEMRL